MDMHLSTSEAVAVGSGRSFGHHYHRGEEDRGQAQAEALGGYRTHGHGADYPDPSFFPLYYLI